MHKLFMQIGQLYFRFFLDYARWRDKTLLSHILWIVAIMTIHLVKLCVGIDSYEHLAEHRRLHSASPDSPTHHVTRMWPKREAELLDGGSLYWVIKGTISARQKIISLEERIGADGIRRCSIVMDPNLVRTKPAQRRAFQGWRYLKPEDAPPDLTLSTSREDSLPPHLASALSEIGIL